MSDPKNRIFLSPPHMSGNEMKYIQEAFDQNWVAPIGPNVDALEEALCRYCKIENGVALSSGTAAIHLALIGLGIKKDDEVLVSSFTFSASANPVVYQHARPVFIDSEKETWNMDPDLLELAIKDRISKNKKPAAIIVVHLYGMPARMDEIMQIANHYEIPVIEDAAEALGSKYKGKPVGYHGKMTALSFNGNKIITTSGGGALLSDDKKYTDTARFLATQARDNAPHYQHSHIGYNYRMSNIVAGIGRAQMEILDERVKQTRHNYFAYKAELEYLEGVKFMSEPGNDFYSNFWLTTILIDPDKTGLRWQDIQNELEKENIESRPLWKPMHLQPVFKSSLSFTNGTSEKLFQQGICLPSGSNLSEEDRNRVIKIIKACFR